MDSQADAGVRIGENRKCALFAAVSSIGEGREFLTVIPRNPRRSLGPPATFPTHRENYRSKAGPSILLKSRKRAEYDLPFTLSPWAAKQAINAEVGRGRLDDGCTWVLKCRCADQSFLFDAKRTILDDLLDEGIPRDLSLN